MNSVHCSLKAGLPKVIAQSLMVGTLSVFGILAGLIPELQPRTLMPTFSTAAYAQSFSATELRRFAQSIMEIEPRRQRAYDQIKRITGEVPSIACDQPNTIRRLSRDARAIAEAYCEDSRRIVSQYDLSIERFNEIAARLQRDSSLETRIQTEIRRIQSSQ